MKFKRSTVIKLGVLIFIGLFGFWFIGWESIQYDKSDSEIGKKIIFTQTMLYITNIPDNFAGRDIAKKYGADLQNQQIWKSFEHAFPRVSTQKVNCDEIFQVDDAFYIRRYGLMMSDKPSSEKYYVLSSKNYKQSVIRKGNYEANAKNISDINDDNICQHPGK